jgi:hypothetical protein
MAASSSALPNPTFPSPSGSMPRQRTGLDRWIDRIAMLFVLLMLVLSPLTLNSNGWNYDAAGGAGPTRFHPATYTVLVLYLLVSLRHSNPISFTLITFASDIRLALFFVVWAFMSFHAVVLQQMPVATLVDTFLLPMLMLILFRYIQEDVRTRMRSFIHVLFFLNAIIAMGEFATQYRISTFAPADLRIVDGWRASALFGHPLGNSLFTGCYTGLLLMGGAPELKGTKRFITIICQFAAMVAFGGRASLVLLFLFAGYAVTKAIFETLAGRRVHMIHMALLLLAIPALIAIVIALAQAGFFDKLIGRFINDGGSANARIVMFELFRAFTFEEILFGPQSDQLFYEIKKYDLEWGIESLWVSFALFYGILPSILFFAGLTLFIIAVMEQCQFRGWLIYLYFFVVNTTFLGIGGKTVIFSNVILITLLFIPKHRPAHASSTSARYEPPLSQRAEHEKTRSC